jgi:hypothetical protein
MKIRFNQIIATITMQALCIALLAACGASEVQRIVSKADYVAQTVQSLDPAGQLLAERLITIDEAEFAREKMSGFMNVFTPFDTELTAIVKANPNANLASIAPAFANVLIRFNEFATVKFKDPKAQLRYEQILGAARIGMTFIAAFFASKLAQAEKFLKRQMPSFMERAQARLAGVPYDKARLSHAREISRAGGNDAGARAVCDYFQIQYDERGLVLLRAYGAQGA